MPDIKTIADRADVIVGGYAFTREGDRIHVLNLNNPELTAGYWMIDETPGLVGCEDGEGNRVYRKKYFWSITAKVLKLSWLFYEGAARVRLRTTPSCTP